MIPLSESANGEGDEQAYWKAFMAHRVGIYLSLTAYNVRYIYQNLRFEIDARILANQPQLDIALGMPLPLAVVKEYESLYFDVRNRLPNPDLVWGFTIGGKPDDVLHPADVVRFWYGVGYEHGISVLEPFLKSVDCSKLAKHGLIAYLQRNVKLSLDSKLLVARKCCSELRTEQGMDLARQIAARPDWQLVLHASKTQTSVFGRVVSLLRKEIDDRAREECRARKKAKSTSLVHTA